MSWQFKWEEAAAEDHRKALALALALALAGRCQMMDLKMPYKKAARLESHAAMPCHAHTYIFPILAAREWSGLVVWCKSKSYWERVIRVVAMVIF